MKLNFLMFCGIGGAASSFMAAVRLSMANLHDQCQFWSAVCVLWIGVAWFGNRIRKSDINKT